jgi:hypothetical protein
MDAHQDSSTQLCAETAYCAKRPLAELRHGTEPIYNQALTPPSPRRAAVGPPINILRPAETPTSSTTITQTYPLPTTSSIYTDFSESLPSRVLTPNDEYHSHYGPPITLSEATEDLPPYINSSLVQDGFRFSEHTFVSQPWGSGPHIPLAVIPTPGIPPRLYLSSPNYNGSLSCPQNWSEDIPDEMNCALWLTRLPHNIDCHRLLNHIRGVDKIWALVINPPDRTHHLSAAKLVFWTHEGALRLTDMILAGTFVVEGHVPKVVWNRIRTSNQAPSEKSRVIRVTGAARVVNKDELMTFFKSKERWYFDLDEILQLPAPDGIATIEFRFGSCRLQAESAKKYLERDVYWKNTVLVEFGPDPCA